MVAFRDGSRDMTSLDENLLSSLHSITIKILTRHNLTQSVMSSVLIFILNSKYVLFYICIHFYIIIIIQR